MDAKENRRRSRATKRPPAKSRARPSREADLQSALYALHRSQETGDVQSTWRWLQRARRLDPDSDMIALSFAATMLRRGEARPAQALFEAVAARHDVLEAWLGAAAAALRARRPGMAVVAMQAALSRHRAGPGCLELARRVATAAKCPGWCAVVAAGRLEADKPAELLHDGAPFEAAWTGGGCAVPQAGTLAVLRAGEHLLGSPIDLGAIASIEGFVRGTREGGLEGWAWHPRDPDRSPDVLLRTADGSAITVEAEEPLEAAIFARTFARPRRFAVSAERLPAGPVQVFGTAPLWGSPIDPGLEHRSAAGLEDSFRPVWADTRGPRRGATATAPGVDVVVPVFRGAEVTLACLRSVLPTLPAGCRLIVVDDGGVDRALGAALDAMAAAGEILLHRLPVNRGFPAAANTGLSLAGENDAVLLNSDTLVPPGWLPALREAAYSAPDIASVSPLSNDATILSYPHTDEPNPFGNPAKLAALARRANRGETVEIPVSVGFCMYIRRDSLRDVGVLREDLWAQGYGEENDWCLRARHRGWRHVAATGCYVAHRGGASFGAARHYLIERNTATLERLHPGYAALIAGWIEDDPLALARRRMDALRWATRRSGSAVILVTHRRGGGVERVVQARSEAYRAAGKRPIIMRPGGVGAVLIGGDETPNLRFRLPEEWEELLALLRPDRVERVELHHTVDHDPAVLALAERLAVPYDFFVHDYATFCARISLVPQHSYCGEPPVISCEACVADFGREIEERIAPAALVARSTALLEMADRVIAPAQDVATRIRRHFPQVVAAVTPWENDGAIEPPSPPARPIRHVCIVGAIGVDKGYEVLLSCARDARLRKLPIAYTVVGYTQDDERLMSAGPVWITGRFAEPEALALVREQAADIAFLPSIWPETWCFALSTAWRAGLWTVVFDLGAQAERVRRTGWGDVLPLGIGGAAINNWLLRDGLPASPRPAAPSRPHTPSLSRPNPAI